MSDSNSSDPTPVWKQRRNLIAAGGIAVVVLGLGAYFLLFAGSSSSDETGVVAGANRNVSRTVVSASASPAATVPAVYKEDVYGNPFSPLYPPLPTATASAAAAGSDAGAAQPAGNTGAQPAPAAPNPETTVTSKSVTVKLIQVVDEDTVIVRVNNQAPVTVNQGVEFAGTFSLANTRPDEDEATFNYGDGEPFTLGVGETQRFTVTS